MQFVDTQQTIQKRFLDQLQSRPDVARPLNNDRLVEKYRTFHCPDPRRLSHEIFYDKKRRKIEKYAPDYSDTLQTQYADIIPDLDRPLLRSDVPSYPEGVTYNYQKRGENVQMCQKLQGNDFSLKGDFKDIPINRQYETNLSHNFHKKIKQNFERNIQLAKTLKPQYPTDEAFLKYLKTLRVRDLAGYYKPIKTLYVPFGDSILEVQWRPAEEILFNNYIIAIDIEGSVPRPGTVNQDKVWVVSFYAQGAYDSIYTDDIQWIQNLINPYIQGKVILVWDSTNELNLLSTLYCSVVDMQISINSNKQNLAKISTLFGSYWSPEIKDILRGFSSQFSHNTVRGYNIGDVVYTWEMAVSTFLSSDFENLCPRGLNRQLYGSTPSTQQDETMETLEYKQLVRPQLDSVILNKIKSVCYPVMFYYSTSHYVNIALVQDEPTEICISKELVDESEQKYEFSDNLIDALDTYPFDSCLQIFNNGVVKDSRFRDHQLMYTECLPDFVRCYFFKIKQENDTPVLIMREKVESIKQNSKKVSQKNYKLPLIEVLIYIEEKKKLLQNDQALTQALLATKSSQIKSKPQKILKQRDHQQNLMIIQQEKQLQAYALQKLTAPREKKYGSTHKMQKSSNNQDLYVKKETLLNRAISTCEIKLQNNDLNLSRVAIPYEYFMEVVNAPNGALSFTTIQEIIEQHYNEQISYMTQRVQKLTTYEINKLHKKLYDLLIDIQFTTLLTPCVLDSREATPTEIYCAEQEIIEMFSLLFKRARSLLPMSWINCKNIPNTHYIMLSNIAIQQILENPHQTHYIDRNIQYVINAHLTNITNQLYDYVQTIKPRYRNFNYQRVRQIKSFLKDYNLKLPYDTNLAQIFKQVQITATDCMYMVLLAVQLQYKPYQMPLFEVKQSDLPSMQTQDLFGMESKPSINNKKKSTNIKNQDRYIFDQKNPKQNSQKNNPFEKKQQVKSNSNSEIQVNSELYSTFILEKIKNKIQQPAEKQNIKDKAQKEKGNKKLIPRNQGKRYRKNKNLIQSMMTNNVKEKYQGQCQIVSIKGIEYFSMPNYKNRCVLLFITSLFYPDLVYNQLELIAKSDQILNLLVYLSQFYELQDKDQQILQDWCRNQKVSDRPLSWFTDDALNSISLVQNVKSAVGQFDEHFYISKKSIKQALQKQKDIQTRHQIDNRVCGVNIQDICQTILSVISIRQIYVVDYNLEDGQQLKLLEDQTDNGDDSKSAQDKLFGMQLEEMEQVPIDQAQEDQLPDAL